MSLKLKLIARAEAWRARMKVRAASRARGAFNVDGEKVGVAVAVTGGIFAILAAVGAIWIPVTTLPLIDDEILVALGVVLVIIGAVIAAAD